MSNLLSSKDFGLNIYNRFPNKYREDDVLQSHALKRYIEALSDGGFSPTIEDLNRITTLINFEKVDSKVLPLLFQQYGFDVFNGIPEQYLRYFLPKLGEAYALKGSMDAVEFITSSLSGVKVALDIITDDYDNQAVDIKFEMDYNLGGYFPDATQFSRILNKFLPFYLTRTLMYSYMFYENQILRQRENEILLINDVKDDSVAFMSGLSSVPMTNNTSKLLNSSFILNYTEVSEVDFYKDSISYLFNEYVPFNKDSIEVIDLIKTTLVNDNINMRLSERTSEKFTYGAIEESLIIGSRSKQVDATLGSALMGEAVLGLGSDNSHFVRDTYTERVMTHHEDILTIESDVEEESDVITITPTRETSRLITTDSFLTDGVSYVYNETTSILSKGVGVSENAVFGEAVMGLGVFAKSGDYSDVTKDHLTLNSVEEYGNMSQPKDKATFMNSDYGTLNNGFTLNSFINVVCDIVNYSDGRKSYFIHN